MTSQIYSLFLKLYLVMAFYHSHRTASEVFFKKKKKKRSCWCPVVFSLSKKKVFPRVPFRKPLISRVWVLQMDRREEKAPGRTQCIFNNCGRNMTFPSKGQLNPWEVNFKGNAFKMNSARRLSSSSDKPSRTQIVPTPSSGSRDITLGTAVGELPSYALWEKE